MLYLHAGWPRTSTSSLQAALFEHRDRLASAAGLTYPEYWTRSAADPAHNGLYDMLDAAYGSANAFEAFRRHLAADADRDVLLSAEGLSNWLLSDDRREILLGLLAAARTVTPTRCVWTLRRLDDASSSLYMQGLKVGLDLPPPQEYIGLARHRHDMFDVRAPSELFAGLRRVEEAVDGDVVYVKYDASGAHNGELLSAFDIPAPVAEKVLETLERGPRLNTRLSHKQAAALLNLDALSARAGVDLDEAAIRAAIRRGEIRFENDRPCEPLSREAKRALHERALAAAREQGFEPYLEFFGEDEIRGGASAGLGPEALAEEDLRRLAAHLDLTPRA
jgi:hypothetical protein